MAKLTIEKLASGFDASIKALHSAEGTADQSTKARWEATRSNLLSGAAWMLAGPHTADEAVMRCRKAGDNRKSTKQERGRWQGIADAMKAAGPDKLSDLYADKLLATRDAFINGCVILKAEPKIDNEALAKRVEAETKARREKAKADKLPPVPTTDGDFSAGIMGMLTLWFQHSPKTFPQKMAVEYQTFHNAERAKGKLKTAAELKAAGNDNVVDFAKKSAA